MTDTSRGPVKTAAVMSLDEQLANCGAALVGLRRAAQSFLDAAALESMTKAPEYIIAKRALRIALASPADAGIQDVIDAARATRRVTLPIDDFVNKFTPGRTNEPEPADRHEPGSGDAETQEAPNRQTSGTPPRLLRPGPVSGLLPWLPADQARMCPMTETDTSRGPVKAALTRAEIRTAADNILDRPSADPDDDAAILARFAVRYLDGPSPALSLDATPGAAEGLREALLLAVEEVDNCWTDEGDHIEWDSDSLPERLIALRKAYSAFDDAALTATPAEPGAENEK